jgi:hypothetical protein
MPSTGGWQPTLAPSPSLTDTCFATISTATSTLGDLEPGPLGYLAALISAIGAVVVLAVRRGAVTRFLEEQWARGSLMALERLHQKACARGEPHVFTVGYKPPLPLKQRLSWWWRSTRLNPWRPAPPPPAPTMMELDDAPACRDLVLVGGGHAHVHVLKMLGMHALCGVQVTLVTRDVETPYSGMLPGHVAGLYSHAECHIDLRRIARFCRAVFVHDEAVAIDRTRRLVVLKSGRPALRYDVLSVDIGITPRVPRSVWAAMHGGHAPSCEEGEKGEEGEERGGGNSDDGDGGGPLRGNVVLVKPIDTFSKRWEAVIARVRARRSASAIAAVTGTWRGLPAPFNFVVVGAGAGGVEMVLAMQYRLHKAHYRPNPIPASIHKCHTQCAGTFSWHLLLARFPTWVHLNVLPLSH